MTKGYLLDNARPEACTRFEAISALFDRWTFSQIDALGIKPGWRCWEVGAGSTNVPAWLYRRVAPAGEVLATDIDTVLAEDSISAGIDVRRHDVGSDAPPWLNLDLVHARLVLVHVTEREQAIRNMISSLKPGGWLLLEDADPELQPLACPDQCGPEQALANKVRSGFRSLMRERGVDLAFGRKLPRLLRNAGMIEVEAEAFFPVTHPASTKLERATVEMLRSQLINMTALSQEDVDRHLSNMSKGSLDLTTAPLITVRGRKAP